jgi:hypothetical protein
VIEQEMQETIVHFPYIIHYGGDWVVGMFIFALVSFLALMTELYWRERIRQEQEEVMIWEDMFYALERDDGG